ncbi:hypothetical protein MNBD_GAMMA07-2371 [hydrothermal vent metagenome]|uniref:Uncharacterized protein n=1 Tax=hydrothermal vent metagenome TaxID=652676 RepID=A0A3B0WMA3_9ZZZZ
MFILLKIEKTQDDLENLPENMCHKLTFKLEFTINDVPDTFTGIVFENTKNEMILQHFNNPKGNKRKVITLKNKLVKGGFDQLRQCLFVLASGGSVNYPQPIETLKRRISGTPRLDAKNPKNE